MKGRYTLILFLLNLLVAGVIVYLHTIKSAALTEERRENEIFQINLENADYIQISGKTLEATRELKKTENGWVITKPVEWKANLHAINRVLNQMRWMEQRGGFSVKETLSFGQTLNDFGLENPRLMVTVGVGENRETLRIGDATSVGDRVYALNPAEDYIHVLSLKIVETLMMQIEDLRAQEIFEIPAFEATSIRIQNRRDSDRYATTTLVHEGKSWNFETPFRTKASTNLVEEMVNRLTRSKVVRFLDIKPENYADYGLETPRLSIRVEGNKRTESLLVGNSITENDLLPQVYARLSGFPTVFTIPERQIQNLRDPQNSFRERRIYSFEGRLPTEIVVKSQEQELSLKRQEGGDWQFLQKSDTGEFHPEKAEQRLVESLVEYLDQLEVIQFVLDAPSEENLIQYGLLEPRIELTTRPGEQTLLIGKSTEEKELYVQVKGKPFIYSISDELLKKVTSNPLFYKDRILQKLSSGSIIESISLFDTSQEVPLFQWDFPKEALDQELSNDQESLIPLIREFKVEGYTSNDSAVDSENRTTENETAWPLHLKVVYALRGDASSQVTRNFFFQRNAEKGKQLGTSPDLKTTFFLTQEWKKELQKLLKAFSPAQPEFGDPIDKAPRTPEVERSQTKPSDSPLAPPQKKKEPTDPIKQNPTEETPTANPKE